ncbi:MAG TPA: N,N-dimethylformamidase beta subunit family domain-containing protein, partial [Pedococcus sp.]|nr:N,N-dimethylformamidase beta subunit family domain-containing protein [Pedococcus sp.]
MNRRWIGLGGAAALVASALAVGVSSPAAASPCDPGGNAIVCENSKPGTPQAVWDIQGSGDATIQGFATSMSVNLGDTESFKIDTTATAYTIDIYRLGWYNGDGARKVASVSSVAQDQPDCLTDSTTGLVDCGNWSVSASWAVPSDAVSGI